MESSKWKERGREIVDDTTSRKLASPFAAALHLILWRLAENPRAEDTRVVYI